MKNKELKNSILNELDDDALDHVSGGTDDDRWYWGYGFPRIISMPAQTVEVAYIPGPHRNQWEVGSSMIAVPAAGKAVRIVNWLPVTSITGE